MNNAIIIYSNNAIIIYSNVLIVVIVESNGLVAVHVIMWYHNCDNIRS